MLDNPFSCRKFETSFMLIISAVAEFRVEVLGKVGRVSYTFDGVAEYLPLIVISTVQPRRCSDYSKDKSAAA